MSGEVKRIRAVFEADTSKYNTSLNGINKQMKLAKSEAKLAQKELQAFGNSTDGVAKVQEKLNKQIELHNKKIDLYNKALDKSKNTIDTNVSKREELNQKIKNAETVLKQAEKAHGKESEAATKAKEHLDQLKQEYNKNEKAIENNIKKIADYETNINNAKSEIKSLEGGIQSNNLKLQQQADKWKQAGEKLDKFGDKAIQVGSGISTASNKVLGLSASLAGVIGVSSKFTMDFEEGIASINTLLDDTKNLDKYRNKIIDLSNDTGIAIDIVSDGMYQAISSLGDLGDETNKIFEIMTKGAKAGKAEVSDSVSLISAAMKGYGSINEETARKVSDLAFQTAKLGVTTFPEMAKSMQPLFPLASTLNISLEDLFGSMATLTGVTGNTAEVSTQLKAVFSNLIKPTKEMSSLMSKYGYSNGQAMIQSEGLSGVLKILQKETGGSSDKMGKLFSSTEALTAILALTGEQYDTFIDKSGQMNNSLGATDRALEKVEATSKDKLMKSLNKLKNSFIDLGGAAAPMVEKVSDAFSNVADVISNMDEKTLSAIVNIAGMGLALGVTVKAVGGTITAVGNLSKGLGWLMQLFGGTSAAAAATGTATAEVATAAATAGGAAGMGGLITSLGGFVTAAAPWLLAGGAIIATGAAIHKGMSEEVIPSVDLFADHIEITGTKMTEYGEAVTTTTTKISEETAKQVQAYLDLDESAKFALSDLYYSSQVITDETVNGMTSKYSAMGEMITSKLAEDKAKDTEILSAFFANSQAMATEDEAETLRLMEEGYAKKTETVNNAVNRINEIITNASNEKRQITQAEMTEINNLQEQMRTNAINTLSEQEVEAQIILDRMKAYDNRVTAEQASEHIKNFNNQRDKAIDAANTQYRKVVDAIERQRDETGALTDEQAKDLIKSAELQRDETIKKAKETRDGAVKKIEEMNEDIIKDVDTSTGKIMSWWDKLQKKWDDWFPKKKTFTTETIETKTTVHKSKKEPPQKGYSLNDKLNYTMYRQLQNNMIRGLNIPNISNVRSSNNNINISPEFEGILKIQINDGKIISKNIKFIDKSLNKRRNNFAYGGLE